jgi:hypothetical protein
MLLKSDQRGSAIDQYDAWAEAMHAGITIEPAGKGACIHAKFAGEAGKRHEAAAGGVFLGSETRDRWRCSRITSPTRSGRCRRRVVEEVRYSLTDSDGSAPSARADRHPQPLRFSRQTIHPRQPPLVCARQWGATLRHLYAGAVHSVNASCRNFSSAALLSLIDMMTGTPRRPKTRRSIWFEDALWERLGVEEARGYQTRPELIHQACSELLERRERARSRRRSRS